ncbi:MAG: SDR family oxidoreductase [Bryobacteraceae bacterium]|nr:SDR family oxidoreductase [Bryobacteraceae bacterium]
MRPVALVTGASSGIGEAFARQLSARGYGLILVARREDRLIRLANELGRAEPLVADLADAEARAIVAARIAQEPAFQLLVNNAGFGTKRRFWNADLEGQQRMHQLHVMATVDLTHAALKAMTPRGRGGVINVASVAGFARSPSNVSYCATKTWMIAFTEALALELRGAAPGVRVQALCPGFTYSEFHDVLGTDRGKIAKWLWMRAGDVVRASLDGLDAGKVIVVPGWQYRVFVTLMNHLPWKVKMAMWARSPHTRDRL